MMKTYNWCGAPSINIVCCLHYGRAPAPLAQVVPDARYPGMWRIAWADGSWSDIVNLSLAKDAAVAFVERGPPARNRHRLHWKHERSKTPYGAPPVRFSESPLSDWQDRPASSDEAVT